LDATARRMSLGLDVLARRGPLRLELALDARRFVLQTPADRSRGRFGAPNGVRVGATDGRTGAAAAQLAAEPPVSVAI